jgi:uncharacterized protein (TIGR02186 family)
MKTIATMIMLCMAGLGLNLNAAQAAVDLGVTLTPAQVLMGANYNGQQISISGRVPSGASALIRVTGPPEDRRLKQKGRALGLLWMNMDSVEISKVPDVFLLYLPPEARDQQTAWTALGIGLEGVRDQAEIVTSDPDKAAIFNEFVKLKQKSGLYGVVDNAVLYGADDGRMKPFSATLALPAALPQGKYQIEVLAIENGTIDASTVKQIDAHEIGMPALVSKLAFDHGTLYGILAVLVAIIAGLGTGLLFKDKGGAH